MKILQICSAKTIGGGERHAADLSNSLAQRGHEIYAALKPDSPLQNLLRLPANNLIVFGAKSALNVFAARRLAKFVRDERIEIIHAHAARDYLTAATCSRLSGKPFVLTRHVLFPMKRANRFFLRRASGVIAVSGAVGRALSEQKIFPADKIKVIRNGIDTRRFAPLPNKHPVSKNFRVGAIGELSSIKRHEIFINAAAKVLKQNPNVEFEIIGEDKTAERKTQAKLKLIIEESGLQNQVKLSGWLDDVVPFLNSLDVFVSASRFDAFGLAIAESMACAVPTITTNTAAAREIIAPGENGILFPVDDADALAGIILDLIENQSKRERLGIAGRRRIETEFSLERMVDETENFYRAVLSGF